MSIKKPVTLLVVLLVVLAALYVSSGNRGAEESPAYPPSDTVLSQPPKAPAPDAQSAEAKRVEAAYTGTRTYEGGRYVTTVNLTDSGFQPQIVSVNRGESVRFVNKSSGTMRIASNDFQGVPLLAGLNQEKSVGANGTYELTVSDVGVWGYHNQSNLSTNGILYVK